jgi:RNA 2',3'-cyclic 3'-phosphodiesterase
VRLFTALWPTADAVAELAAALPAEVPDGWRRTSAESWHVTLAFHGEADPGVLARGLDRETRGLPAPRLRIGGVGAFPGVRWAGVDADPVAALHDLVAAAGGDVERFTPHVTLLRRRARSGPDPATGPLTVEPGSWWQPADVLLMATETAGRGPRYRVVHRVALSGR